MSSQKSQHSLENEVKSLRAEATNLKDAAHGELAMIGEKLRQANAECAQLRLDFSTIVVCDGSRTSMRNTKVTGFTVAAGVTTIGMSAYYRCPKLASLGEMREGVRVIEYAASAHC